MNSLPNMSTIETILQFQDENNFIIIITFRQIEAQNLAKLESSRIFKQLNHN